MTSHNPNTWATAALLAAFIAALGACSSASAVQPDNAAALADIQAGRSGDEVVVEGIVTRRQQSSRGPSGEHERFRILVASGAATQEILVADNISVGEAAPVERGDDVIVKGVLEIDERGPVIHWTHHDPRFRHPGGFVILRGTTYD